ncbi:hypothetical protein [Streptomyces sp. NPDC097619]|uniref:hypothetical protein n=1 Tax=Streptomyces sp. NPDC097619 TaxID=3157228 RepID=UPI0033193A49
MTALRFPEDLVRLQAARLATYQELARQPPGAGNTLLRRRLIRLSAEVSAHPYWRTPGGSQGQLAELSRQARRLGWTTAA